METVRPCKGRRRRHPDRHGTAEKFHDRGSAAGQGLCGDERRIREDTPVRRQDKSADYKTKDKKGPLLAGGGASGVKDVAFSKRRGFAVLDMVKSNWVYKQLRNFRAGIEANISTLKRAFGLDRCNWSGREAFKQYVWSSIVSYNLLVLARLKLKVA